jgi:pimeloyl-ACP methyl ester carboxylesterase
MCRGQEFDGMKGTLFVPENRARPNSRQVELPIVVVKSLSSNPDYPVFQCTGGPGISNINPGEHIGEADLKRHDIIEVGYRGVDGTPTLNHPVLNGLLATPNLLSEATLQELGKKASEAVRDLQDRGIDVGQYNIQNVVEDMEAARVALGYDKINITGGSYGGAVAFVYCLRYGARVNRAVLIEAAFPYDMALTMPELIDARLAHLNELWKNDAHASERTPDIVKTIREVLAKLPANYNGMALDRSKIEFLTYFGSYFERSYANMVFDAYVSAERGDFGSLAVMSLMYDQLATQIGNIADLLTKTYCTVTRPDRDFVSELARSDSIIGSPMSMMAWGMFQYTDWPVQPLVKEHPPAQKTHVQTLVIYGSRETGEPLRQDYAKNFTDAHWVMFEDLGHNDIWTITGDGIHHLILRFLDEGVADTSKIGDIPGWDFTPKVTFWQMFQQMTQGETVQN